jgi:hypothetical protein
MDDLISDAEIVLLQKKESIIEAIEAITVCNPKDKKEYIKLKKTLKHCLVSYVKEYPIYSERVWATKVADEYGILGSIVA